MSPELLALLHLASTWALVGVIWIIQLVHYPMFDQVDAGLFKTFHERHTWGLGIVAGPLMCFELVSAVALVTPMIGTELHDGWFIASLITLVGVWLSTFLIQVPLHNRLARGFDTEAHQKLVRSNRWRAAAWTARGVLVLVAFSSGR